MNKVVYLIACGLAAGLLIASCDVADPEAIPPSELIPRINSGLTWMIAEDNSVIITIEAVDPNNEPLTLRISSTPFHGEVELIGEGAMAARQLAEQPGEDAQRPRLQETPDPPRDARPQKKTAKPDARVAPRPQAQQPRQAAPQGTTGKYAGVRVEAHLAQRLSSLPSLAHLTAVVDRIRYMPDLDFEGADSFMVEITNASGFTAKATVVVIINAEPDPPMADQGIADSTLKRGDNLDLDLRAANVFKDPENNIARFEASSGDLTIAEASVNGNVLTVRAKDRQGVSTMITVTAIDSTNLSGTTTFTVTVTDDNQEPRVVIPIPDTPLPKDATLVVDLDSVFFDPDGDLLTFSEQSSDTNVAEAEILPPSTLRVTMKVDGLNRVSDITVTANDGRGGTVDESFLVKGVDPERPTVADDEETTRKNVPVVIDVLANDFDPNPMPRLRILNIVRPPANGTAELFENDTKVRYTPNTDFLGNDDFTYIAINDSSRVSEPATVRVMVIENEHPMFTSMSVDTATAGQPYTYTITATDPENDPLMISAPTLPGWLMFSDNGDGTALLNGIPAESDAGDHDVVLVVDDGMEGLDRQSFTITVEVDEQPIRPIANNDAYNVDEGATLTVNAGNGVLANDTDANNDPLIAVLVSDVVNGSLTLNSNGSFTYVHNGSETTADAFTYKANDGMEDSEREATVIITVAPINDPPIAVVDSFVVGSNNTLNVAAPGVLVNDTDEEGDALTAVQVSTTGQGTLTLRMDGSFTYTPNTDFSGGDLFTYRANDGEASSIDPGLVRITVVRDTLTPPEVTNPGPQMFNEGDMVSLQIEATDPDGDLPLTYTSISLTLQQMGLTLNESTGLISGTHPIRAADNSPYTVTVFVTDSEGAQSSVTFEWTVINPQPVVIQPPDRDDDVGDAVSFTVDATDDDALLFEVMNLPMGVSPTARISDVMISGTIAPGAAASTPYIVTVRATDPQGAQGSAQFEWTVENPAPTLTSISPAQGRQGQTRTVVLRGTNFYDGVSQASFSGGGITINSTTINNNNPTRMVLRITIDAGAALGPRDVTVDNDAPGGGSSTLMNAFTVIN